MSDRIVHSTEPFNVEPSLERLRARFVTDASDFYVRCHSPIPQLAGDLRLRIGGRVAHPLGLSLDELRTRFERRSVAAAMQCAGNRRADLDAVRPVSGDKWGGGAIGQAEWTGVGLADVLRAAGVDEGEPLHVAFEAADDGFAVSIPLAKALAPEVLLAWEMNGAPLRPEHGAPLRALVPGYAGIRSAKWLRAVEVRDAPPDSKEQAEDYKLFPAEICDADADPARGLTINDMPLNAAICDPARNAELPAGPTRIRGWAIASGRPVARVDVSADSGRRWVQATLQPGPSIWSWTFWEAQLDLQPGDHELAARAWDSAGQTQPSLIEDVWNYKGYLCNAWHRVPVRVR